ncbi:unnamed protein product [Ixodes persulcatus]
MQALGPCVCYHSSCRFYAASYRTKGAETYLLNVAFEQQVFGVFLGGFQGVGLCLIKHCGTSCFIVLVVRTSVVCRKLFWSGGTARFRVNKNVAIAFFFSSSYSFTFESVIKKGQFRVVSCKCTAAIGCFHGTSIRLFGIRLSQ